MAMIPVGVERSVEVHMGDLYLRLAETPEEISAAQALRYRVFFEDMNAVSSPEVAASRRDFDDFDDYCDHLLVFDLRAEDSPGLPAPKVVGTYRVMRRDAARRCGRFYTSGEYDISPLLAVAGEVMELGRSCIDAAYRDGPTMQLLWRGIGEYVLANGVELMFGCASLPGTNPDDLAMPLSHLHYYHLAPPELRPRALAGRFVAMDRIPRDELPKHEARAQLPPLIKGYLRLGGFVGEGAVVDYDFGTTDVCVVVKTDLVSGRYYRHYARRHETKTREPSVT